MCFTVEISHHLIVHANYSCNCLSLYALPWAFLPLASFPAVVAADIFFIHTIRVFKQLKCKSWVQLFRLHQYNCFELCKETSALKCSSKLKGEVENRGNKRQKLQIFFFPST